MKESRLNDHIYHHGFWELPGPPKEPKIMAQYPKIESIGSIGSIILAILEVQVNPLDRLLRPRPYGWGS